MLGDGGAVLPNSGAAACPVPVTLGPDGFCVGVQFAFADESGNYVLGITSPGTYSVVGFQLPQPGGPLSPEVILDIADGNVVTCNFTLGTTPSSSCDGVEYDFDGFFAPVNNPPTLNTVDTGRGIPVKFSLGGDQGLDVFADGYPKSQSITAARTRRPTGSRRPSPPGRAA